MSPASVGRFEECGVVDIDAICGYLSSAQFENVGERDADHRSIVARVGNLSFANAGPCPAPRAEQPMSAGCDRRKKSGHRSVYRFMSDDDRRVAEPKLRICGQKLDEVIGFAGVDDREHALPPRTIDARVAFTYDIDHSYSIRAAVAAH
jgi:hypothetical protein